MSVEIGILIGRFQPLHSGHLEFMTKAAKACDVLRILVGSSNVRPNLKNPFTYNERKAFIYKHIKPVISNFTIDPLPDQMYNYDGWLESVVELTSDTPGVHVYKIFIVEKEKETREYAELLVTKFAQHNMQAEVVEIDMDKDRSATEVRAALQSRTIDPIRQQRLAIGDDYWTELAEHFWGNGRVYQFIDHFNKPHKIEVCADNIIELADGSIISIIRKDNGAYALPGGHLDVGETFYQAAVREAFEETGLDLPSLGTVTQSLLVDNLSRAPGRHIITKVFHWKINAINTLKVHQLLKAGDDAKAVGYHDYTLNGLQKILESHNWHHDHNQLIHAFWSTK